MSAMARFKQCVVCDNPTDQPRHVQHPSETGQVDITECWTRHQADCQSGDN